MANFHVHVYKLAALCQVDVDAGSPKQAMKVALAKVKEKGDKAEFTEPDNEYIALPFEFKVNE